MTTPLAPHPDDVAALALGIWGSDEAHYRALAENGLSALRAAEAKRGMVLVPVAPTEAMARRFIATYVDQSFAAAYRAMIAARPRRRRADG